MASGVYRVEISSTNRAGCKNKECKDNGVKISKGQLRFGTYVTIQEHQSWQWKHWGCVTPKQISHLKDSVDDDAGNLDGYEDLPADFQEKIEKAIQGGHVADEDWNGDVEMNRVGKNGFRTPATKKARNEEAQAKDEGAVTPSRSSVKKRGRVKNDPNAEGAEDNGPPAKKKRTNVKKEKNIEEEHPDELPGDEAQPVQKGRRKPSNVKPKVESTVKEEGGDDDAVHPTRTKKVRAPRKSRAVKKAADQDADSDASNSTPGGSEPPPSRNTRLPRRAAATKKIKDEETDSNALSEDQQPPKMSRASRQPATSKKIKTEAPDEVPDEAPTSAAPAASKKPKAAPKKASSKSIKNEAEDADRINSGNANDEPNAGVSEVPGKSEFEREPGVEANLKVKADVSEEPLKPKKGGKRVGKKQAKGKQNTD